MQRMKSAAKNVGVGVLILAIVLGAGGGYYFKSYLPNTVAPKSFPQIDGEIKLDGLDAPVDVYRDHMGIPHIYASTLHDLFFAQGYVHAQDRFWQMDAWRHIGSGRVSEMFSSQVDTDKFLRTLGWREVAEKEWEQMPPDAKQLLQNYTDGVNAYLKDHKGEAISLEYAILKLLSPDYKIALWEPVNTLTWAKAMAWDLRGNMDEEVQRAILLKTLSKEQIDQLFPPYPADHPVIVNEIGDGSASTNLNMPTVSNSNIPVDAFKNVESNVALLDSLLGPAGSDIGSNNWVIGGSLTTTGKPFLANDPHLSIQMPSIWYQMDLQCKPKSDNCPYGMAGFTFAGVPGVILGHNDHIAWGVTNTGPDVMDLYIEKVNPDNPNQYEVNGKWVDFETRKETINVAGGNPVEITVRLTRHGPVISDTFGPLQDQGDPKDKEFVPFKERAGIELPPQYVIALKWTALEPTRLFEAVWGFDKARNWQEFRDAARNWAVPAQNLVFADTEGNIGYQMPGNIPIRKNGDGRFPVPGWTDDYEWTGYIPFDQLPYTYNPADGFIATANNQVPPRDYPFLITTDWDYGFRAQRIVNLIKNAPGKIDMAYIQKIQGDSYDANAETFVPLILDAKLASSLDPARDLLKNWDYQAKADSAPAAIFEAFWKHLLQNTFDDDLPEKYWPSGGDRWYEAARELVKNPNDPFWDDKATPSVVETRDDMIRKSFADGVAEVESLLGRDMSKWSWGALHTATFRNGTLGKSGIGLIEALFNRGPFPASGGGSIVNATAWDATEDFTVTDLPSMRMIVDLSDLNNSVTVHTTGQSGHAYNKHYDDMPRMWAEIQYYPMLWSQEAVVKDAEGHLLLTPK